MADVVISAEKLGKRYQIGVTRHETFRDRLSHALQTPLRRLRRVAEIDPTDFWALRDVSFEVRRGETLGIIGHNGAGKSTLLKILSRITEPTSGSVRIRGRVASLLEVGTGFHPELTGRDNIFLNGAILGMQRAEIRRKFDEIVAFAEVEKFIDTPVKRYSSGMYVRLAFAVAAHLEPEILIVDEVLAVGDLAFQKKCLGKMESVAAREGRTVLFVSHNLNAMHRLCSRALLLSGGNLLAAGTTTAIIDRYSRSMGSEENTQLPPPGPELLDKGYLTGASIENTEGRPVPAVRLGVPWQVRITFRLARAMHDLVVAVGFVSGDGIGVHTAWAEPRPLEAGDYEVIFAQSQLVLSSGSYTVLVGLNEGDRTFQQVSAARVDVTAEQPHGYFPMPSGAGYVLNSMPTRFRRL